MKISTALRSLTATIIAASAFGVSAHECELPTTVTNYVNRRSYYAIKADVSESQATAYSMFNNSEPSVAFVVPLSFTSFQRGLFVITGNSPGQSIAALHWVYAPNNAFGDCIVTINVFPESAA